jgi:hypothetical protein
MNDAQLCLLNDADEHTICAMNIEQEHCTCRHGRFPAPAEFRPAPATGKPEIRTGQFTAPVYFELGKELKK